jgi:hypothetical protein
MIPNIGACARRKLACTRSSSAIPTRSAQCWRSQIDTSTSQSVPNSECKIWRNTRPLHQSGGAVPPGESVGFNHRRLIHMARRSVPPPKPQSPTLTVGQKRRRIERVQKCIARLEAFDPQKARKRAPAVLELEAAIDKALSSAFGSAITDIAHCGTRALIPMSF